MSIIVTFAFLLAAPAQSDLRGQVNVLAAKDHFKQGNFAQAAEILDKLLVAEPAAGPDVYLMLIDCRMNLNQSDEAIATGERGLKQHPNSGSLAKRTGELLFQQSYVSKHAGELLAKATKALPNDPAAHHFYGQWALLNHQEEIAIAAETRALALSPTNALARMQIYTVIGLSEDALNRTQRAEAAFRQAWEANRKLPTPNPATALELALFLSRQSREDEAQRVVGAILGFAPNFSPARLERAKYLAVQGETEKALAEARVALDHADQPKTLRAAHAFLAKTYFALGRTEEAKVHQSWIESH